jgi:hypothetical protein
LCFYSDCCFAVHFIQGCVRVLIRNTEHCRASLSLRAAYHFSTCSTFVIRHASQSRIVPYVIDCSARSGQLA